MAAIAGLRLGRRVWIVVEEIRVHGRIATLPPVSPDGPSGAFVVLLDGKNKVISYLEVHRGTHWDFAEGG